MTTSIHAEINKNIAALKNLTSNNLETIDQIVDLIIRAITQKNKILFVGVGGNAMICESISQDIKGHYRPEGKSVMAFSLSSEIGIITRNLNDIGADDIFSAQLDSVGQPDDILFSISSSGKSKSIISAVIKANKIGIKTISITGESGGALSEISSLCLKLPSNSSSIVENLSLIISHIIVASIYNKSNESE